MYFNVTYHTTDAGHDRGNSSECGSSFTRHRYQQWPRSTYSTPHTLWEGGAVELDSALTAATILADAAVTPTVSEMTYNVSSGTLNHTQPTNHVCVRVWCMSVVDICSPFGLRVSLCFRKQYSAEALRVPFVRPLYRPSINTYFARRDSYLLRGILSTKLVTNIHHVSRHCPKGFQSQRLKVKNDNVL